MRVLADLLAPVEAETAQGGRTRTYEALGVVWLAPGRRRRRERTEAGVIRELETLTAETRADDRLTPGRVLRWGGADWTITAATPGEGAAPRMTLELERSR